VFHHTTSRPNDIRVIYSLAEFHMLVKETARAVDAVLKSDEVYPLLPLPTSLLH
jgi:hypothetical protein